MGFKITPLYSFAPTIFIIFIDRRFIKQKDRGESLEGEEATQVTKDRVEGYKREQNTGSNPWRYKKSRTKNDRSHAVDKSP